jgi:hypothetical protein
MTRVDDEMTSRDALINHGMAPVLGGFVSSYEWTRKMKTAISTSGKTIVASDTAPATARCPRCGGVVKLRSRRRMGGDASYFWRHGDNQNLKCPRRLRPVR